MILMGCEDKSCIYIPELGENKCHSRAEWKKTSDDNFKFLSCLNKIQQKNKEKYDLNQSVETCNQKLKMNYNIINGK